MHSLMRDWKIFLISFGIMVVITTYMIQIGVGEALAVDWVGVVQTFKENFSASRIKSNEEMAVTYCKIVHFACWVYHSVHGRFPLNLQEMGDPKPPYIDPRLAKATKPEFSYNGYFYTYASANSDHFTLMAEPKEKNVTGSKIFFVDNTGYVRLDNSDGPIVATASKP
jgi:hypothetical protein